MPRPTSFRLDDDLLERLETESRAASMSTTSLVSSLLDEGLKTRQFPGVVYRPGPTGRRAALLGGPDVWEVIRDLRHWPGKGMERVERLADELGLSASRVGLAADFYSVFPEEIDARIEENERAAEEIRRRAQQRETLLSS
ncbi:hypothetical protein [Candidatus Poriferisocius sp.]|uniref:hypothetical protein n=1 Tax=Candidatus Poriferisocius sp. TaxID=3101276 RepID=UPI003B019DFC